LGITVSCFVTASGTGIAFDYAISSDVRFLLALFLLGALSNAQTVDPEKATLIRQIVQASSPDALKKQILAVMKVFESGIVRQNPNYPFRFMPKRFRWKS
jgi:hypothetical protein